MNLITRLKYNLIAIRLGIPMLGEKNISSITIKKKQHQLNQLLLQQEQLKTLNRNILRLADLVDLASELVNYNDSKMFESIIGKHINSDSRLLNHFDCETVKEPYKLKLLSKLQKIETNSEESENVIFKASRI